MWCGGRPISIYIRTEQANDLTASRPHVGCEMGGDEDEISAWFFTAS